MVSTLLQLVNIFGSGACVPGAAGYHTFLGLVPWYEYVNLNAQCNFDGTSFVLLGSNSTILLILLAVVDDLLRVAGLLAVGFVIYAGAKFITSNGAPDEAAKARTTAINALVGLGITMVAVTFVSFLGNQLGGNHMGSSHAAGGRLDLSPLPAPTNIANGGIVQTVLGIVFGVLGALSFMIMVIAGMRYALSQGDANAAAQAKNTIIYALVGLVLAITAESVVSFVVSR